MIDSADAWSNNWAWGVPLIVLTVLAHSFGLVLIRANVVDRLAGELSRRRSAVEFAAIVAVTVLLLTILHVIEAIAWATAYVALGARPAFPSATLYSLSAMTSYGHASVFLSPQWRLMGALEALNGMMLFGVTTAFLFSVLQSHWPTRTRDHG